jgi:uncharacterized integral membrane protein (TIGR00697 family)
MGSFVTVLLCSNLIGPGKTCLVTLPLIGAVTFGAGNLFFPISYIFDDVLTEVYGYAQARKVIWAGFGAMVFATIMGWVVIHLPADPREPFNAQMQPALQTCFGNTWRIVAASVVAFWAGDFANSYVLAKMKIWTGGRWLWTRTIGSTIVGEAVDSALFYPLAFYNSGLMPNEVLPAIMLAQFVGKVGVEVVFTPVTYKVVGFLKRAEQEDYYDRNTDFSPFRLKV